MLSLFRSWSPNSGLACAPTDDYQWLLPPPGVKQLVQLLVSVNEGQEFVPLLASWLFLLAALNLSFPGLLPALTWPRFRRIMRWVARLLMPWVMFCMAWRPFNHLLLNVFTRYARMPGILRAQWLPFSSLLAAVWTLFASLRHTGYLLLLAVKKPRRRRPSGNRTRLPSSEVDSPTGTSPVRRRTRSGQLLPSSPGITTRSGAIYGPE